MNEDNWKERIEEEKLEREAVINQICEEIKLSLHPDVIKGEGEIEELMKALGYTVDEEGYIVSEDSSERAVDIFGDEVKRNNLGMILSNPTRFIPTVAISI